MSLIAAVGVALYYWIAMCDTPLVNWMKEPIVVGFIMGLAFGDVSLGLQIGASISLLYIVAVAVGGNMPSDKTIGAIVAIPIAIVNNLEPELALAIAVPIATCGTALDNLRRMIAVVWNRKAYKDVEKLNIKGLYMDAYVYPVLTQLPIRFIPIFAIMYFGASSADSVLAWLPTWFTQSMSVLGGMLPAIGMVACVKSIGRSNLMLYFIAGYFLMKLTNMNVLVFGILSVIVALIAIGIDRGETLDIKLFGKEKLSDSNEQLKYQLTKKELKKTRFRSMFLHRTAQSMENYYGTNFCVAALPCLQKLYGHDDELLKEALRRHLVPYITNVNFGACIEGAAMAMEEQIANGADIDPDTVTSMRTGLMGPFAGMGDTINGYILSPIIKSCGIALCAAGNPLGLISAAWWIVQPLIIGIPSFNAGYKLGKESLLSVLEGGWMERLMTAAGILGMTMMGALSANYVKLKTVLQFTIAEETYVFQDLFESILPGFLPFCLLMFSFWYMKRPKASFTKLILVYFVIAIVGVVLGIL